MGQAHVDKRIKRFLLIDDDPIFCGLLGHYAETQGVVLHYYTSLLEFGNTAQLGNYDVAILDFDMGEITGPDSAGYVSGLFGNIPVLLISGMPKYQIQPYIRPGSIHCFVQKSQGCPAIMTAANNLCTKAIGNPTLTATQRQTIDQVAAADINTLLRE
jgi:DNA-binding NtrC family response regulator